MLEPIQRFPSSNRYVLVQPLPFSSSHLQKVMSMSCQTSMSRIISFHWPMNDSLSLFHEHMMQSLKTSRALPSFVVLYGTFWYSWPSPKECCSERIRSIYTLSETKIPGIVPPHSTLPARMNATSAASYVRFCFFLLVQEWDRVARPQLRLSFHTSFTALGGSTYGYAKTKIS